MSKFCAVSFIAMMIIILLCPGLAAQTGYYVEQNFVGIHFSPYGIQVAPDGSCYTYGSYFYYDGGSGPLEYGTGFSGNDPYGTMLWGYGCNYTIETNVYTVGIDVEANGDFHTLNNNGFSTARISANTWHPSGTHSVDFTAEFDILDFRLTKAVRLSDTSIAVVGSKYTLYQGQYIRTACYCRFSSAGALLSSADLYMQPGDLVPANNASDILLMNNGNLLISLHTANQASVAEITPAGQVIGTTAIPGTMHESSPLCLVSEPGTSGYLAGLMTRQGDAENYKIRICRIVPSTAELLYTIEPEHLSSLSSIESSHDGIIIIGRKTDPSRLGFICLDPQGNIDWTWYSLVYTWGGNGPLCSNIGPDGSLYWVGLTNLKQVLVKLPANGSFVSINDEVIPLPSGMRAYPNPTRENAKLRLPTAKAGLYEIKTYNLRGQLLKTETISYEPNSAQDIAWEAKDNQGNKLPSGVYLIKLVSGSETISTRITVTE